MTEPIGPERIAEKKKQYLIPCIYHFYRCPPQIVRGEGAYLFDSQGRRYLDLYAGVSVHALGHCHPEITEAICNQVRTLQHTTTIYLTEPIVNLAEALAEILPGKIRRTFFCASGSEANEGAALLACLHTGRNGFLAFQNGLHGRTKLTMSLTGLPLWRTDPYPVENVTLVPHPTCFWRKPARAPSEAAHPGPALSSDCISKCPLGRTYGSCGHECVQAVESAIRNFAGGPPAAMFVEPVQGNGGVAVPPPEYFAKLREVLDRHGVLLVADEVQTGFGRTGRMFAMQHWGVTPDIVTGGKALGGGTPIGFFATTDPIAASYTRPGASTFGGNPVTAAAGLAFLRILRRDRLAERSDKLGLCLQNRLEETAVGQETIRQVRGLGLMIGVEIGPRNGRTAAQTTDEILERMKDAGYLLGKTGPDRNVLTWMPPLIVEEAQLDGAVHELAKIIQAL